MSRGRTIAASAVASLLMAVSTPAAAQVMVTLYAGYAGSDGVENTSTDAQTEIRSTAVYAVAVGSVLDGSREVQLLYQQQSTTLTPGGGAAPFNLTIRYLHLGGTVYFDGVVGQGPYVVGGLGATQFSPSTEGFGNEFKPSINLGLGYAWPLGENIALRAEARGYFTFVNSSGGFLCSGGCVVVLRSDVFLQYNAMLGISARF